MEERGFNFVLNGKEYNFIKMYEKKHNEIVLKGYPIITIDFFTHSIINSACNIDDAFNKMLQDENYLCAIPLIRMQLDNALMTWAFLICSNEQKFFNTLLGGKEINQLKVDWNVLSQFEITKERLSEMGIAYKPKEQLLTNRFLYETLNLVFEGTAELYKKSCTYVHPSASILKAALFTKQAGQIKYKDWEETKPFGYSYEDIITDYLMANRTLLSLLNRMKVFKETNSILYNKMENGEKLPEEIMKSANPPSMEEAMKTVDLLRHKGDKQE